MITEKQTILVLPVSTYDNSRSQSESYWWYMEKRGEGKPYHQQQEPILWWMIDEEVAIRQVIMLTTSSTKSAEEHLKKTFCEIPDDAWRSVDFSKENLESGIIEVVDLLNQNPHDEIVFDIHGGFRDAQYVLDDIMNLINLTEKRNCIRYTVEFDSHDSIIKKAEDFGVHRLVSGMQEFFHTGRGEGLIEFFDSEMKRSPAGKEYERISRLVKDISDSISLCDVIRFEESLKRMRDWLSKERRYTSYVKLFVKYIKEDYGSLLSDDVRLLDEILWCNKKGFIQQALTLIESRMPEVICSSDLFYVDWSQEIGNPAVSLEKMVNKAKKKEVEKNSYILLVWAREKHDADLSVLLRIDKKRFLIDCIGSKEIIEDNPFDRKVIWCEGDFNIKYFKSGMSSGDGIIPMSIRYSSEDVDKSRYTIIINEEKKDAFISFINIHFWLKNQRNKVNHVNTNHDREDATGIGRVINLYVDRACKLGL